MDFGFDPCVVGVEFDDVNSSLWEDVFQEICDLLHGVVEVGRDVGPMYVLVTHVEVDRRDLAICAPCGSIVEKAFEGSRAEVLDSVYLNLRVVVCCDEIQGLVGEEYLGRRGFFEAD